MADEKNPTNDGEVTVDRARLGSITVYDVTEDELEMIERGTPSSNYFNFSIALLSIFSSFLITLLSTKIESDRTFMFFLFTAIITFIVGGILFLLWFKSRDSVKNIFRKIRARKNSDEVRQAVKQAEEGNDVDSDAAQAMKI